MVLSVFSVNSVVKDLMFLNIKKYYQQSTEDTEKPEQVRSESVFLCVLCVLCGKQPFRLFG